MDQEIATKCFIKTAAHNCTLTYKRPINPLILEPVNSFAL